MIQEDFGQINQQPVYSYTLISEHGLEVTAINYGCIITKILAPDPNGNFENIAFGHDTLNDYLNDTSFLGAVVGRVGGRIKGSSFELDGKTYDLAKNDGNNHLHGGIKGFDKVVWEAEILDNGVRFSYVSKDGEEGYPGNLAIDVIYTLNNDNELSIQYGAKTDQKTVLTVTNHSYFNLSGNLKRDVLNHSLTLKSDQFLELDEEFIPTGHLAAVADTPFDFTMENISRPAPFLSIHKMFLGKAYDHPFVLNENHDNEIV